MSSGVLRARGLFIKAVMTDKKFKTHRQQLNILRSRGMVIGKGTQGSRVIQILKCENYYNVINGYKELFLSQTATPDADEQYKTGTTFDEVYALYKFDRELRILYLQYILKIENTFKTVIAHEFSALYGHDNYLKIENFDISTEQKLSSVIQMIGDIQQELARQMSKHHNAVTHYMTQYGYIPLWVLVNVLTFGKIEKFYKNMKQADKVTISRQFRLQPDELAKFMHMLTLARNKCAHDERFFDIRFKERIHTRSISNFSVLGIVRAPDGSFTSGTNDAYAILIMFALLLSKSELKDFVTSIKTLFKNLNKKLHVISIIDVMNVMGFGLSWENLTQL